MPPSYTPPYTITSAALSSVAEIAGLLGRLDATSGLGKAPMLRRENRIRSIHSSLAIENNTLTLEQVTAFIEFLLAAILTAPQKFPLTDQVTDPHSDQVAALLRTLGHDTLAALDCMKRLRLSHRPTFRTNYLAPALEAALIQRTIPEKPNSRLQNRSDAEMASGKYRLTAKGRAIVKPA